MIKYFCDRCEKELPKDELLHDYLILTSGTFLNNTRLTSLRLCEDCKKHIIKNFWSLLCR